MSLWKFWNNKIEEPTNINIEKQIEEDLPKIKALDLSSVSFIKSPNQSVRKGEVKYLVLHHTGPGSFNAIVNWLTNSQAKASAHYVVGTNGQIKQLVNTHKEAWHAGRAEFNNERIDNHHSIGIEICNIGHITKDPNDGCYYYEQGRNLKKYTGKVEPVKGLIKYSDGQELEGYYIPYPEKQIEKVVALCKGIIKLYPNIQAKDITTHYEIARPIGRKNDPFGLDMDYIRKLIFIEE